MKLSKILLPKIRELANVRAMGVHRAFIEVASSSADSWPSSQPVYDKFPLEKGREYQGRYAGYTNIPTAIFEDLRIPRISWRSASVLSIGFGHIPTLVQRSPQILFYEYGGSAQAAQRAFTDVPAFFRKRRQKFSSYYWVPGSFVGKEGLGRFGEGFILGTNQPPKKGDFEKIKATKPVRMFGRTMNQVISRLPSIMKGRR